jgi:hypothetical protein
VAQLAIPPAPRKVSLTDLPGAVRRLALVAGVALALTAVAWGLGFKARAWLATERDFLARAIEVEGVVAEVTLPKGDRDGATARLRVLYTLKEQQAVASDVPMDASAAAAIGPGAHLTLLVDPQRPGYAREKAWAEGRKTSVWVANLLLGLGVLATVVVLARELRRALRREVAPLHVGAIVWLTPSVPTEGAQGEFTFPASYYRDDVKHEVTARASAGNWVRKGDKVLAALVPSEPTWVRVIDEALARRLGWYR